MLPVLCSRSAAWCRPGRRGEQYGTRIELPAAAGAGLAWPTGLREHAQLGAMKSPRLRAYLTSEAHRASATQDANDELVLATDPSLAQVSGAYFVSKSKWPSPEVGGGAAPAASRRLAGLRE